MKLQAVKKSFTDSEGKVIGYTALVVSGKIQDIPFEIPLKPYDDSKIIKQALINNADKCDVTIFKSIRDNLVTEKVCTTIPNLGDVQFKCTPSDIFIIKLYSKLEGK